MYFPNNGYKAGPLPPALTGNTDVPLKGIWGQLEHVPGALARDYGFDLMAAVYLPAPQVAGCWPCPGARSAHGEQDIPIWRSLAKRVLCCQLPGPVPDPFFAQLLMNSAKRENTLIMNWAEGSKVLQINGNEIRTMHKRNDRKGECYQRPDPVNRYHGKRLARPWVLNRELKKTERKNRKEEKKKRTVQTSPAARQIEDLFTMKPTAKCLGHRSNIMSWLSVKSCRTQGKFKFQLHFSLALWLWEVMTCSVPQFTHLISGCNHSTHLRVVVH